MGGKAKDDRPFRAWAYGLLAGLLMLEFFVFAWCRVQCVQGGYDLAKTEHQAETLKDRQKELKAKLAHLKNPDRITRIARQRLGLVTPGPEQVVVVK